MDYVILYTFMFFYETIEEHYHADTQASEISLVVPYTPQPNQVSLLINE